MRQNSHFTATLILTALLAALSAAPVIAAPAPAPPQQSKFPPDFIPSGKQMFKEYCAACHGLEAKGHGPARNALKIPAADLTTLAQRHGGDFPYDYVTTILRFGPGLAAHGSSDMPTWGPIFEYIDNYRQPAVMKRIKRLTDYIATLQEK
jgi:mono/diheme cytochrome c family protein